MLENIETVVYGKHDEISLVLASLAGGGHVLFEDVPGTAKTVLARAIAGQRSRARRRADPVHARPAADRRHRALDLQPEDARLRVPPGAGLRQRPARRRDQPRDAEDAVGPARGDGRAAGHGRRRDAAAARPVLRDRDREPDRAGGHLPAARGAARPLRRADDARLSRRRGGGGGRARAAPRPSARQARAGGERGRRARPAARRSRRSTWTSCCCGGSSTSCARPARWRGSRSGPRCAAASRSSGRRGRGRSCTAATTWCRRTSRRSSCPCSATGSWSRRRSSPRRAASAARTALGASAGGRFELAPRAGAGLARGPAGRRRLAVSCRPRGAAALPARAAPATARAAVRRAAERAPRARLGRRRLAAVSSRATPSASMDWHASAKLSSARGTRRVRRPRARGRGAAGGARLRPPSVDGVFGAPLPWLSKPAAFAAVVDAIVVSAVAARGDVGTLDERRRQRAPVLAAAARGPWPLWRSTERVRETGFDAPADNLEQASRPPPPDARRDPAGELRLRRLGLPRDAAARGAGSRGRPPLGRRPGRDPGPGLGAELPGAARRRRPVRDPATGRVLDTRLRRGEARERRLAHEARLEELLDDFVRIGLEPVVIGTSDPVEIDHELLAWADRRRRAGRRRR